MVVCVCVLLNKLKKSIKKISHYASHVDLLGGGGGGGGVSSVKKCNENIYHVYFYL